MNDPDAFIRSLPKAETHLHLEGATPWHFLTEADPGRFAAPPRGWREDYRYASFEQFETELISYAVTYCNTPERYQEVARHAFAGHLMRNVRYVEVSFASGCIEATGQDGAEVAAAIAEAAPAGLEVRVFMGVHRNGCTEYMRPQLEACHRWRHLDGIDLHGTEPLPLEDWTPPFYERMREAGKATKAHAGEFGGPGHVREVIERLGVTRIEHGVRAAEDPGLVGELARAGITLDVCPISNVKLGVAPSLAAHPLRALHEAGVRCTLSTDDPIMFGNEIEDEYRAAHEHQGFSADGLARLARNGLEAAHADERLRAAWLAELDAIVRR